MLVKREFLKDARPVDPDAKPETANLLGDPSPEYDDAAWADLTSADPAPPSTSVGGQYLIDDADKARQRLHR